MEVPLPRLRIGHIRLSQSSIMAREATLVSVLHVLVECPAYSMPRNLLFPSLTSMPPREPLVF